MLNQAQLADRLGVSSAAISKAKKTTGKVAGVTLSDIAITENGKVVGYHESGLPDSPINQAVNKPVNAVNTGKEPENSEVNEVNQSVNEPEELPQSTLDEPAEKTRLSAAFWMSESSDQDEPSGEVNQAVNKPVNAVNTGKEPENSEVNEVNQPVNEPEELPQSTLDEPAEKTRLSVPFWMSESSDQDEPSGEVNQAVNKPVNAVNTGKEPENSLVNQMVDSSSIAPLSDFGRTIAVGALALFGLALLNNYLETR